MFTALVASTPWPEKAGSRTAIGPFHGGADARCIAELARPGRLIQEQALEDRQRELPFYLEGELEILAFPDWETLPYDNFSPHQDIISERLHTLHRLPRVTAGVLIVPVPTLMHRLPPDQGR